MDRLNFAFLCILYIAISILSFAKGVDAEVQLAVCLVLISIVGIPHGAIDHILFLKINDVHPILFYGAYFLLMILYLICWFVFPVASMVIFLVLSAYHFGESQLNGKLSLSTFLEKSHYLVWGTSILSALIVYNHTELIELFNMYPDLVRLLGAFPLAVYQIVLAVSTALTLALLYNSYRQSKDQAQPLLKEVYTLAIIHIAFYILPLLPAFTLYFAVLHSVRVLLDEFTFLQSKMKDLTAIDFVKQLVPYTAISLIGGAALFSMIHYELLNISYVFLSIILISILTLPHSVVMNRFYTEG